MPEPDQPVHPEDCARTTARAMWERLEPLHAVTYFSDEAAQAAAQAGYRGFWMGYFACRLAPLGAVGPEIATAVCFGFDPGRVARALPDAWTFAPPQMALNARQAGAAAALSRICGAAEGLDEAADLAWEASQLAGCEGRVLAAANQALPRPSDPWGVLWQAATTLREHRGDGHNAALVAAAVSPTQAHWLKIAAQETDPNPLQVSRNWSAQSWQDGRSELQQRGWLNAASTLTDAGHAAHQDIESRTDHAAGSPWHRLGIEATGRLADLLAPLTRAVLDSDTIPFPNPVGLNKLGTSDVPRESELPLTEDCVRRARRG